MKTGTREVAAALLGGALAVFIFAAGQAAACGCDASGELTDDGRYEIDLGSLESAPDGKAASSVARTGNDGGIRTTAVLQHEAARDDDSDSELAAFLKAAEKNLNSGPTIFCAATQPVVASKGCSAGAYVPVVAGDTNMTESVIGNCATIGNVL